MDDEYIGKVNVIDAIVVGIIFYGIVGRTFDNLSFILKILMTIPICLAYYQLVKTKYVGVFVPFVASFAWTVVLVVLLPISHLTKGNPALNILAGIPIFLLVFKLHVREIQDFITDIPELLFKKPSAGASKKSKAKASTTDTDKESAINSYESAKEIFYNYKNFISSKEIVFTEYQDATEAIGKAEKLISETDPQIRKKKIKGAILQNIVERTLELYQINGTLRIVCYRINERINGKKSNSQGAHDMHNNNEEIDTSLFSGCTDQESITRRYRQLMKTFHPDNQNGDTGMTQKIQKTYDYLMNE